SPLADPITSVFRALTPSSGTRDEGSSSPGGLLGGLGARPHGALLPSQPTGSPAGSIPAAPGSALPGSSAVGTPSSAIPSNPIGTPGTGGAIPVGSWAIVGNQTVSVSSPITPAAVTPSTTPLHSPPTIPGGTSVSRAPVGSS